ncbi:MAG: hypothetical protein GY755_23490 [Chloroflexi bacterium]|nr:hypothetical protein [Chloroflexota bacterium]
MYAHQQHLCIANQTNIRNNNNSSHNIQKGSKWNNYLMNTASTQMYKGEYCSKYGPVLKQVNMVQNIGVKKVNIVQNIGGIKGEYGSKYW